MKISPNWLRELTGLKAEVKDHQFADDITLAGIAVEAVSETPQGSIFEMDITTNRVDAMNHYGIAREISALYDLDLKPLSAKLPAVSGASRISVQIDVPQACARFTGQEMRNVKIGPSSAWVVQRFKELEQKPINNAADATNYVLLLMGKPTHAFDADRLAGGKIIVRMAKPGESLKTLDGVERKLHPEDVVVADAEKAVALAGVMGGFDSMITEATKNIFIESAWWDPASVRRTARRHGMHTDASHRFERGADWASCPVSTDLVAQIILESGGELAGKQIDVIAREVGHKPVALSRAEVTRILGKEIGATELERILRRLGFALTPARVTVPAATKTSAGSGGSAAAVVEEPADYSVSIPTWRLDVEREIDVIEEIARVHGYNQFPNTLPHFSGGVMAQPQAEKQEKIRRTLLALGYTEALSSTFVARADSEAFSPDAIVEVANPLSEEASAMRTTLTPGMLEMLGRNLNRGEAHVRLFEYGHVYAMHGDKTDERPALCFAATASAIAQEIGAKSDDALAVFRAFKGDVETLLSSFGGNLYFDSVETAYLHPGRSARAVVNGGTVARFGQLHPDVAERRKLKQPVYLAEVAIDRLFSNALRTPRYQKLSRFPAVDRDFSFLLDDAVGFAKIEGAVKGLNIAELREFTAVEVFRGGSVPAGNYSILLRAVFQSLDRTLRDDEVASWAEKIVGELKKLGGIQR
jgi:phenylalanyl-tRNA synthetase beta chain